MGQRKRFRVGMSVLVLLVLLLSACRQEPVAPREPLDFGSDPRILRGRWGGLGVSGRYGATAFSPGGELFAAATKQGFRVWEVATGTARFTLPDARPTSAAFSPDASLLVLRDPQTLRVLSAETGEVLASARADTPYPDPPLFSPDGSWLATDQGERVRLWRVARTAAGGVTLTPHDVLGEGRASYKAFSPDSSRVLVGDDEGMALRRVADGALVRRYPDEGYWSATFGPDGSIFFGGERSIRRLSLEGEVLGDFSTAESYEYRPVVSPDGRYLVNNDSERTVWDVASGRELGSLAKERPSTNEGYSFLNYALAFGLTGDTLYAASGGGEVAVQDLPTGPGATPEARELFRAETFALTLDLTASYVDTSSYAVAGTFRFGDGAPQPVEGSVCVSEGLTPRGLEAQTSPGVCEVYLAVGDDRRPTWTARGIAPVGAPPVTYFEVNRGDDFYVFEVTRENER